MRWFEILTIAFDALIRNKMRSLLTMLGIIIGVGAVIAMIAIGQGASFSVESQIASLGQNVLMIYPGATARGGVSGGAGSVSTLTVADAEAIVEQCPSVAYMSPILRAGSQVVAGNLNWSTSVQGGTADFFAIRDWKLDNGELFSDADVKASAKVCVIGKTVADNLFQGADPVGQMIRIRNIPFKIVGTMKSKGQSVSGQDQDDIIVAPYTTVQKRILGINFIWGIMVSAISKDKIFQAQQEITEVLRVRHRLQLWDDNDFTVRNQTDIAETATATSKIMTILLGSIASVSLLVGGIGIMNIMLVSVTERTREIGIRMSIGARRRDILSQFLMEAIVLSLLGGFIGIIFGVTGSNLISKFADWPTFVSEGSIVLAVFFSMAVGVFFGFYPARKAASMNPIDALRYE
ncbi:MAG: ABC transporter permease [Bacteroidota bacterium]|nr:ABC transporter permease [Bacteroidota bacterium]